MGLYQLGEEVVDEANGYGHGDADGDEAVEPVFEAVVHLLCLGKDGVHEQGIKQHGGPALLHKHINKVVVRGGMLGVAAHIGGKGGNGIGLVVVIEGAGAIAGNGPVLAHAHGSHPAVYALHRRHIGAAKGGDDVIGEVFVHEGLVVIGAKLDILIVGHQVAERQYDEGVERGHNDIDEADAYGQANNDSEYNAYDGSTGIREADTCRKQQYDHHQQKAHQYALALGERPGHQQQREEHGNNGAVINMVVVEAAHGLLHLIELKAQYGVVYEYDDDGSQHGYEQHIEGAYVVFLLPEYPYRDDEETHQQPALGEQELEGEEHHPGEDDGYDGADELQHYYEYDLILPPPAGQRGGVAGKHQRKEQEEDPHQRLIGQGDGHGVVGEVDLNGCGYGEQEYPVCRLPVDPQQHHVQEHYGRGEHKVATRPCEYDDGRKQQ